jgi:hypothetical protein
MALLRRGKVARSNALAKPRKAWQGQCADLLSDGDVLRGHVSLRLLPPRPKNLGGLGGRLKHLIHPTKTLPAKSMAIFRTALKRKIEEGRGHPVAARAKLIRIILHGFCDHADLRNRSHD